MRRSEVLKKLFLAFPIFGLLLTGAHAGSDSMIITMKTAAAGKVRAELSYQTETFPEPLGELRLYHPRLKLIREDRTVLDEALPAEGKEGTVRHIDGPEVRLPAGGGEPEILLRIRSDYEHPGAILIYRYNAAADHYDLRQQVDDEKLEVSNKLETRRFSAHGTVKAELSFQADIMVEGEVTLKLTRDGQTVTKRVDLGEEGDIANIDGPAIIDLDGQGDSEVVLNVFGRGTYCCAFTLIYYYAPARNTYVRLKHSWGPYRNMAVLKQPDRDGVPVFICGNEAFSGEFGPYARSSASPIQIWRYRRGHLQDVTRLYQNLIRKDAKTWWGEYDNKKSDWYRTPYPLAAYLADMHRLGEGGKGCQQVKKVYHGDDRQEFFRNLRRELKGHGYAK
ncbi:MAG: hypothetical protein KKD99_00870 [Proteobacteria bacterium]|nr:hypothetical protein [Pseudomonadota bacterium]